MVWVGSERRGWGGEQARPVAALGEQKARESKRQSRLPNPARPGDQPGMRQPSGVISLEQRGLRPFLSDQVRVLTRQRRGCALVRGSRVVGFVVVEIVGHNWPTITRCPAGRESPAAPPREPPRPGATRRSR